MLEQEGIKVLLTGDVSSDVFAGLPSLGGSLHLQVQESDRDRAEEILEDLAGEESLDEDWEAQAEHDPAVWTCPLCGGPVSQSLSACPACKTRREGIRPAHSPLVAGEPPAETAQPARQITAESPQSAHETSVPARADLEPDHEDLSLPPLETFLGDDLATRAFRSALFACLILGMTFVLFREGFGLFFFIPFTFYSLWLLGRLVFFSGDVSTAGIVRMCVAIALNLGCLLILLIVFGRFLL
jgi:hypothetical protein